MYIHNDSVRKPDSRRPEKTMPTLFARQALTSAGWRKDVRLEIREGRIAAIEAGSKARPGDVGVDTLVPGMSNLHSHAFQRAMAGLAEHRGSGEDSFWSWRTAMYAAALAMTPEDVEAVAAFLYCEMLEAGFTRVGEFHYLHHAEDGTSYRNIAEMAERIAAAAQLAGTRLTLLPVLYAHSGFGGLPPSGAQRRFINTSDGFAALVEASRKAVKPLEGSVVGIAPHSLRAVTPDELALVVELAGNGPIHIHVAEQVKEVDDCIAWSGARPVEWLLSNAPVGPNWCVIHATHMNYAETEALAATGAVAGLCPVTEANLGDGIFPAQAFVAAGGKFGIGTDSNVLVGLAEELRQLEYSQRLAHRRRNVLAPESGSTGRALLDRALAGGASALGAQAPELLAGAPADLVELSGTEGFEQNGDRMLDGFIFARSVKVRRVWTGGVLRVSDGVHLERTAIAPRFAKAMKRLLSVL
jgi:formiminoglutamate deiminase